MALLQDRVDQLVRAYRVRGHLVANIDPLGMPRPHLPELDPEYYGFTEADMDRPFSTDTIHGPDVLTLRRILERLRNTYCRSIGVQFMHMDDLASANGCKIGWKGPKTGCRSAAQEQLRILTRLTDAVIFEEFIQKQFTGRQELFAGRSREPDSAVGPGHRKGGRAGHPRNRDGHGPSRPA